VLFACVYVPNFIAQAAARLDPVVAASPFAVVAGTPPQVRVVALNAKAKNKRLWIGMTKTEAEASTGTQILERSIKLEASAHGALLDCTSRFSPHCEDVADDTLILDVSELSKLLGTPTQIAKSIRAQARNLSLYIRVGIAGNIDSAIYAARTTKGISILPFGKEAEFLKDAPLDILNLSPKILETLTRWGIRTFGQLGTLPELSLSERLGQEGLRLQQLVRGQSFRTLSPTSAPVSFEEGTDFDYPVEDPESLAFVFHRLLEQLTIRLTARALAAGQLHLSLELDLAVDDVKATERLFTRTLKLPVPTVDTKLLLKLLQLDLEAHSPGAPVLKVALRAEPMRPRIVQEGIFVPKGPEPQRLEVTLARLRKLVGEDRVGSPELIDRHLPSPFRMVKFAPGAQLVKSSVASCRQAALRIFRPNAPARVENVHGAPHTVAFDGVRYRVTQASGPWRRSGEWWTQDRWGRDEWDLVLTAQDDRRLLVRAYRDLLTRQWYIDGEYD